MRRWGDGARAWAIRVTVPLVAVLVGCTPRVGSRDDARLRSFGARHAAAWCSQDAASVAGFFSEGGSPQINQGAPAVGREEEWRLGVDGPIAESRGHFDEADDERQLRSAAAEPAPGAAPDRAAIRSAAREIMEKARLCALVTLGGDGHPQARVMDAFAPEPDMTVWMATNAGTRKVEQIRADPRVTLFYFDPSGPGYVTLLARAEIRTDPAEKAKHWKDEWAAFYADGSRGDDFVLIRCRPIRLEVVSYAHRIASEPGAWRPAMVDFR